MATKPIHLFSHETGPNPWKVVMIFEELGLPYETEFVNTSVMHTPVYEKVNPNGRVPAIHDPNTDVTLWESGAIVNYLIDTYDKDNKLQPTNLAEKHHAQQWLFFQVSGQGPYFGQFGWFKFYHKEQLPSAQERYHNEILRITKVLNGALEGKKYLVGNKFTYADLSFVPWYAVLGGFPGFSTADLKPEYPNFANWMDRLMARPAIAKSLDDRAKAIEASKK